MDGLNLLDGSSDFDSFLNHEFLLGGSAEKVDDLFRNADAIDSPSTFHSPRSMQSDSNDPVAPTSNGASSAQLNDQLHGFGAADFARQAFGPTAMAASASFNPDIFQPRFDGINGHPFQSFTPQQSAEMWRSITEGAGLAQSIGSLALDNVPPPPLQAAPFPFAQNVQIKSEDDCNALSTSLAFLNQPFSTPTQPDVTLPNEMVASPPFEKKRKLSVIDSQAVAAVASVSADAASEAAMAKGPSPKKGGKKKVAKAGDAAPSAAGTRESEHAESAMGAEGSYSQDKSTKKSSQRRPPPSASQFTEAGNPFPVIDTTAKHSSLFVHPDTSGLTKREARLVKNRAAAFLSRQRKREQFEELEVKCKAMSIMAWRMWEVIAGHNAGIERLGQTVLPSLLSPEDPMAIICLEQVIAKQGASIAPTADDALLAPSRDSAEPDGGCGDAQQQDGANVSRPWQADAIDKLKADLAASRQREQNLMFELEALKQARPSASPPAQTPAGAAADAPTFWQSGPETLPVAPFRDAQPHGPLLTIAPGLAPDVNVPSSQAASEPSASLAGSTRIKEEDAETSFNFAVTPTIESFSEAARKSKRSQLPRIGTPRFGLGLLYRNARSGASAATTPSIPSSPSSLSTSSDATHRGSGSAGDQHHHTLGQLANPRRSASSMALMVILFSIALLGMPANDLAKLGISRTSGELNSGFSLGQVLGPVEPASRYSLIKPAGDDDEDETEDERVAATQPSSHLSDTDLSLGFDVDSHLSPQQRQQQQQQQQQQSKSQQTKSQQLQQTRPTAIMVDTEMTDEAPAPMSSSLPPPPPQHDPSNTNLLGSSAVAAVAAAAAFAQIKKKETVPGGGAAPWSLI